MGHQLCWSIPQGMALMVALDASIGEFCFLTPILNPTTGEIYSINEANLNTMPKGEKLHFLLSANRQKRKKNTSPLYGFFGSRLSSKLIKGGVYVYLKQQRLCNINCSTNVLFSLDHRTSRRKSIRWKKQILDIVPNDLHQRVPFFIGSSEMVEEAESYMNT